MIEVEHLTKIYGGIAAINDISFTVEPGEILGFLGPNGAGKTTTMRILTGYLPASSGTARIAGHDVHADAMTVRQRIGYLPENPPLYPDMTVEGFLNFVAQLKGVSAGDRQKQIQSAMARCNLQEKRKVLIRKLSKGFKQRVGIAQAIVHDPPVIILDEPTVGLDPRQIIEVRNLIKSLAGNHTIILSTHILPEVSMTCSRVAIINRGQLVATNSPEKLMTQLMGGAGYEIEIAGDIVTAQNILGNLPEVISVELIPETNLIEKSPVNNRHRLRLVCDRGSETAPEIVAAMVSSGHKLYEIRRYGVSLEEVFLQLTTQEITAENPENSEDNNKENSLNNNDSQNPPET